MRLQGKTAIVTGGSRGIGRAVAEKFLREGAAVALVARRSRELERVVRQLAPLGKIMGAAADVAKEKDVKRALAAVQRRFKKVDILVNAAGIQPPIGPFYKNDWRKWRENLEINLFGAVFFTRQVLPLMIRKKSGRVINFAGGGATSARPGFSAYAVAKTGVVRFTEVLAEELKPFRIQVNAISPGAVPTDMTKEILEYSKAAGAKETAQAKRILSAGAAPLELAAELALFLASSRSNGLTGRLVSAPWDDWRKWDKKKIRAIAKSELYTLRRVK